LPNHPSFNPFLLGQIVVPIRFPLFQRTGPSTPAVPPSKATPRPSPFFCFINLRPLFVFMLPSLPSRTLHAVLPQICLSPLRTLRLFSSVTYSFPSARSNLFSFPLRLIHQAPPRPIVWSLALPHPLISSATTLCSSGSKVPDCSFYSVLCPFPSPPGENSLLQSLCPISPIGLNVFLSPGQSFCSKDSLVPALSLRSTAFFPPLYRITSMHKGSRPISLFHFYLSPFFFQ